MTKGLPVSCFLVLLLLSCSGQQVNMNLQPSDHLTIADSLASAGRCSKAVPHYEQLLSEFPVRETAMRARFGLARCRMELEEYDLAVMEFEDFIDSYPTSELADDSRYMIGMSYLKQAPAPQRDQTKTVEALEAFNLLLREYPGSELVDESKQRILECRSRLAQKVYLSGDLYRKMGHYQSARIYFGSVVSEYGDTPWAAWALLGQGETFAREKDPGRAAEAYERVLTDYPGSAAGEEASRRLKELASEIGKATEPSPGE